jgi:hypothetical protein
MNRIELSRTEQGWVAEYYGDGAEVIQQLLGTTILPTAYTAQAEAATVRRTIERLNPGYTVTVV